MPLSVLSCLVGAIIAGGGVWYWMAQDAAHTAVLFAFGDKARAHERAMQAYQHEEASVAIWEFRHLAELQKEHLRLQLDTPRDLHMGLLITHGHLAKLYRQQNREADAQKQVEMAIAVYRQVNLTNLVITNATSLLDWIQEYDKRVKKETRYE